MAASTVSSGAVPMSAFVRNAWYVAGFSRDIGRTLQERWMLGEPVLLYRTENGDPVALCNRCVHRRVPLSMGKLIGDNVECGYHGFTFDPSGACVSIPSQDRISPKARVRAYPVVERAGLVWVWMGERDLADEALVPPCTWFDHPGYNAVGGSLEIKCRYGLVIDNIMDLSHLTYVHTRLLGNKYVAEADVEIEIEPNLLRASHRYNRVEVAPAYAHLGLKNPVDRWQISEFTPPNYMVVHSGSSSCEDPSQRFDYKALNLVTPATANTTMYYWGASYAFPIDFEKMHAAIESVVHEDVGILEAQEVLIANDSSGVPEFSAARDGAVIQARRMTEELLKAEADGHKPVSGLALRRQMSQKLAGELAAS